MGITAASLIAKVSAEGVDTAKSQLSDMGKATNGLGDIFKNALGGSLNLAAGLAGDALSFLKDQFVDSIQVAMRHQDVMAQTAQAIKSTGGIAGETSSSIGDLALSLSKVTTFSDDTIQSGENLLLTFTGIGKQVFPDATKAMLDLSQATGQDMKSSAIQLGKALNDPLTGMSALQRVGVTFSTEEQKQIKTMMAHNDVIGAQKVMLGELGTEFGGSATAAGKTFAGQMQILGNQFDDIKQKIGMAVLPILSQFMGFISSSAMPVLEKFGAWFAADAIPVLQQFAATLQKDVAPTLQHVAAYLQSPAFASFATGVGKDIASTFQRIGLFAKNDVEPAVESVSVFLGSPGFASFASGVGRDIATVFMDIGHFAKDDVAPAIGDVVKFLQSPGFASFAGGTGHAVQEIFTGIGNVGKQLAPVFQQIGAEMMANFVPAWKQLQPALMAALPALQTIGQILGGVLLVALGLVVATITGLARGIAGAIGGIGTMLTGLVKIFTGIFQIIGGIVMFFVDLVTGHFDKLGGDLGSIVSGIGNIFVGLWDMVVGVFQAAFGLISGYISGFIDGIVGYFTGLYNTLVGHSIIPDMINGIISWFQQLPGRAIAFVLHLASQAIDGFNALKSAMTLIIQDAINTVVNTFQQLPGKVQGIISSIPGILQNILGTLGPKALGWAADMINGFISGIQNGIANIGNAASNIADTIKSYLHFSKPDLGPLADYESWMPDFTSGLARGLNNGLDKIRGASLNVASTLSVAASPLALPVGVNLAPSFASQASTQPQGDGTPIIFQVDGIAFARATLPYTVNAIRNGTAVRII